MALMPALTLNTEHSTLTLALTLTLAPALTRKPSVAATLLWSRDLGLGLGLGLIQAGKREEKV